MSGWSVSRVQLLLLLLLQLSLLSCPSVLARSAQGDRLLVVLDTDIERDQFSSFLDSFKERGFIVHEKRIKDDDLTLFEYNEPLYEHVVILPSRTKALGPQLTPQKLIEFVNKGSNVFLAASSSTGEPLRDFAREFGIDLAPRDTMIVDHFNYEENSSPKHTLIKVNPLPGGTRSILTNYTKPILYRGSAHALGNSVFLIPLLSASQTAYAYDTKEEMDASETPYVSGTQAFLVSAFQTRNNARLVLSSSLEIFSNEFFGYDGGANQQFSREITQWAFKEKGVLKATQFDHHHAGHQDTSESEPSTYRVGDEVVVNLALSEYKDSKWTPFEATDIQLSTIMLDPYIRTTFPPPVLTTGNSALYSLSFKLPDHYGVFHFKIEHKRPGLTYVEERKQFTLRHIRHNEYPRFISSAWVYYTSVGTIFLAWFALVLVWITKRDEPLGDIKKD